MRLTGLRSKPFVIVYKNGHCESAGPDWVVGSVDNAIHWINLYLVDSVIGFANTHPLVNDLCHLSNGLGYLTFEQRGYNCYTSSETQNCNSNPIHVSRNNKIWIEYRISTYQTTSFALSVIKLSQCVPIDYVCCCFPPPPWSQKPLPFSKCFPPGQPLLLSFSSYRYLRFGTLLL